jgi:hypothetical protein
MRLFDGYIDRRPLMERDGSGVSALVGLDGFVVCAQMLDDASDGVDPVTVEDDPRGGPHPGARPPW